MSKQPRDDVYGAYDASYMQANGPTQHTQQPIVTGTSVVAIKFKDGVVIGADSRTTTGSYIVCVCVSLGFTMLTLCIRPTV